MLVRFEKMKVELRIPQVPLDTRVYSRLKVENISVNGVSSDAH